MNVGFTADRQDGLQAYRTGCATIQGCMPTGRQVGLPKSQKVQPKVLISASPPKISNRFPFRLASVKSPHYPKILYI